MKAGDFVHFLTWPIRLFKPHCPVCACRRQQLNAAGWWRLPWAIWRMVMTRGFDGLPPLLTMDRMMAGVASRESMDAGIRIDGDAIRMPRSAGIDPRHALMIMLSRSTSPKIGMYQFGWADYYLLTGGPTDA